MYHKWAATTPSTLSDSKLKGVLKSLFGEVMVTCTDQIGSRRYKVRSNDLASDSVTDISQSAAKQLGELIKEIAPSPLNIKKW